MNDQSKLFFYEANLRRGELRIPAGDILQVAELAIVQESEIATHLQRCDEITYAISGRATVLSGGETYEMSAGQIHYIRRGEYHRIAADLGENFRYCCIGFLPDRNYSEISCFLEAVRERKDFLIRDEGNLKNIFSQLIDEFQIRDTESNAMVHFYFCQMLIQLYRMLSGSSLHKLSRLNTSASNIAVYRALKYMDKEFPSLTQAKQVAQAISYSEYYLCHAFRDKMNMTVKEYLMRKKMQMATELLETSSMTVTEIAEYLSFSSLHSFGIAFKRHTQVSPTEYRSAARVRQ
jgi:AraC-like DNA-binding protein/mannose-6-phosphate isomerase-like protein (cupin superfamily)